MRVHMGGELRCEFRDDRAKGGQSRREMELPVIGRTPMHVAVTGRHLLQLCGEQLLDRRDRTLGREILCVLCNDGEAGVLQYGARGGEACRTGSKLLLELSGGQPSMVLGRV